MVDMRAGCGTASNHLLAMRAAAVAMLAPLALGCSDKVTKDRDTGDEGSGGGAAWTTSTSTPTISPSFPCTPKQPVCQPGLSDCVALVDNAGKPTFGLRMSQIAIAKPAVLAFGLVGTVIAKGLTANLPACNLAGDGTFSWLLEIDAASAKLETGGAWPLADPAGGYCFVNDNLAGHAVAPATVDVVLANDVLSTTSPADLIMPVFLDQAATSWLLLPIRKLRFFDTVLSEENRCIGWFNDELLDPLNNCQGDTTVEAFENAGHLQGYISIEDADGVVVEQLSQSLCTLLSGDPGLYGDGGDPEKCKRDADGNIVLEGDWCAATNSAATADCGDAFALEAAFAASAVAIAGGCP